MKDFDTKDIAKPNLLERPTKAKTDPISSVSNLVEMNKNDTGRRVLEAMISEMITEGL